MSAFSNEVIVEPGTSPLIVDGSSVTQPVSGSVGITGSVVVTGPLTDAQLRAAPVPISGSVSTTPLAAASSSIAQVTSTGSNQMLLASNAGRKKAILFFNSGIWNVKFGIGASGTSRTLQVSSSGYFLEISVYTGQIDAACTTAGKLVDVTELS